MPSWIDRYRNGEREAVWTEMGLLGPLRGEQLAAAREIASETMKRARAALLELADRLRASGYVFVYPDQVLVPPGDETRRAIDSLERDAGPIPIALRAFWEEVGSVNFIGAHPAWPLPAYCDLEGFPNPESTSPEHLLYADPIVVRWAEENLQSEYTDSYAYQVAEGEIDPEEQPFEYVVAPCALHKANISGSQQQVAQGHVADPALEGLYTDPQTFVSYLRAALRHAGFAGFAHRTDPGERAKLVVWAEQLAAGIALF